MDVCTRTGRWAAKLVLRWYNASVGMNRAGHVSHRSLFVLWEETLPCAAAGAAHIQLFCNWGRFRRSTILSIPVCVGGARQRRWDSRAAGAWIPLGKPHLLEAPSKGFCLSLWLMSCILLLPLASLAGSSHLFPTQPENTHFRPICFQDTYTFSNTFSSRDADLWCIKAH